MQLKKAETGCVIAIYALSTFNAYRQIKNQLPTLFNQHLSPYKAISIAAYSFSFISIIYLNYFYFFSITFFNMLISFFALIYDSGEYDLSAFHALLYNCMCKYIFV